MGFQCWDCKELFKSLEDAQKHGICKKQKKAKQ